MKKQVFIAAAIVLCSFAIGAVDGMAQQIFNQFQQPELVVGLPYRDINNCTTSLLNKTILSPSQFVLAPTFVNDLDDGYAVVQFPSGVVYNFNGRNYTSVYVSINGFLTFQNTKLVPAKASQGLFINSSSFPDNVIAPFWGDHRLRTSADIGAGYMPSEISWVVDVDRDENCDTIKPVRRCIIIQWKNLNINNASVNSSVANFQARLYLGGASNNNQGPVELAYGQTGGNPFTSNTTVVTRGATVGMKGDGGFPGFLSDFWNGLVWKPRVGANSRTDSTSVWQPSGGRSDARIRFNSIVYLTFDMWGFGDADTSAAAGQRHDGLPQNRRVTSSDARVIMRSIVTKRPLDSVWKRQAYQADVNHSGRYYFTKLKRDFSGDSMVGSRIIIWRRTIDVEQFFPGQGVGPNTGKQVLRVMYEGDGLYGTGGKAPDVSSLNQIYYEATEYDAGLIMRYISGRLPYLPWVYDNDTTGPDFGKVGVSKLADNVSFGTGSNVGNGLIRVPVYMNGNHTGAFGVRFETNSDVVSVTPVMNDKNTVAIDNGSDIVTLAGNGSFDATQPIAYVTMKEKAIFNFSNIRFNEAIVGSQSLNMVESEVGSAVSVYPNPTTSNMSMAVTLPQAGNVSVRIYDTFGKLVSTIFDASANVGTLSATWNGTDANGTPVVPGTYVVRVDGAGVNTSSMVTVVR
ncbi:MAG: T9SS type A sorting domain-containing protein [Candidatus Kapabacteria bacterium]|nr:T9SS type A sorting domain-containing protein [Candidatus Kapabacteria bacterium]